MAVKVELSRAGPVLVARIEGEMDLAAAAQIREPIEQAWAGDGELRHLVLNLKGVTFLDSTGIAVILGRYRTVMARGGRVVVAAAPSRVRRMLELSGALRLLELADGEEEAVRKLKPPPARVAARRRRRRGGGAGR